VAPFEPAMDLVPELGVAVVKYSIKSHPTEFSGVMFRSRLEARWAAFFELVGWSWQYEPIDLNGWSPDFRVEFECWHSECSGSHALLVEVKPYFSIEQFVGHHCLLYPYGLSDAAAIPADASAAFGNDPSVVWWEMSHGAGGGVENDLTRWVQNVDINLAWNQAGNLTQYHPQKKPSNFTLLLRTLATHVSQRFDCCCFRFPVQRFAGFSALKRPSVV